MTNVLYGRSTYERSIVSFSWCKTNICFLGGLHIKNVHRCLFSLEWFACTRCLCSRSTPVNLFWENGEKHAIILVTIFLLQLAERRRTSTRTSRQDDWVRYFSSIKWRPFSINKLDARKSQNWIKNQDYSTKSTEVLWRRWLRHNSSAIV